MTKIAADDEPQERQKRGTRQLLLGRGCFFACGSVVSVILARRLGAADFGIYGVVISQLLWLEMVTNAGVPGATSKLIADGRHDSQEVERSARALLLGFSMLLLAACWALAPRIASLMRIPGGDVLFRLAILDLPFAALYASYEGVFYGHRRFGVIAAAQVGYGLAKLAGIVALIGLGFSVERVLVVTVLSTGALCGTLALRYRPPGFRPRRRLMGEIAAIAAPLALYLFAGQVLVNLDLWSLKSLWNGGGEVVGQYVASVTLARMLTLIPAVQAGVIFASVAWAIASRDTARATRHIHEATRFVVVIAAAACVILGLDAREVLSVLFSRAYAEGQRFLPLQLAGFGLYALLDAFSCALMAAGGQWFVAGVLMATVPLVGLSNYFLIPRFGPMGAATSMLLGTSVGAGLTGAMACRRFGSVIRFGMVIRVLVAAAVVGLVSATVRVHGAWVLIKIVMLGGLYLVVLLMLGEITGNDFALSGRSVERRSA